MVVSSWVIVPPGAWRALPSDFFLPGASGFGFFGFPLPPSQMAQISLARRNDVGCAWPFFEPGAAPPCFIGGRVGFAGRSARV